MPCWRLRSWPRRIARLWTAGRDLDRRLQGVILDTEPEDADRQALGQEHGPAETGPRQAIGKEAAAQLRRTIGLLHLGGQDSRRLEALERETRNVEQGEVDWPKLGQDLHRAWLEPQAISPGPIEPRREESWARVVPLEFGHAMLGRGSHDPVSSRQVREWTALWSWLSDRMLYEARDLHGLAFHAEAGRGYNPPGRNSPLPEVRLATDPSSLTLTSRDRSATVNLQLS